VSGLGSGNVWDFTEDRTGTLWTAASGLCRLDAEVECHGVPGSAGAVDITRMRDGWFWFGTGEHGVGSFDPATRRFGDRLPAYGWTIVVHADTAADELWYGGSRLYRARVSGGRVVGEPVEVPTASSWNAMIFDMRRDARGRLWLASRDGLQRWDSATHRFAAVDLPQVQGTTVFSLADDADGWLWLGTAHGLVQFSPETGAARLYRRRDGVRSGEFNRRAALRRRGGEMVFGGVQGLTIFRPEQVNERRAAAPLVFTRWQKATRTGRVEGYFADEPVFEVRPGEHAFTIDFAALTFAAGPDRRYRYRIDGLSADWIETSEPTATYATPPAGRYTLRVQAAAGAAGAWAEPGAALALRVIPPLWATTAFRALLLAVLLGGLRLLHQLRLKQAVATERLRLRIAHDLHDELGAGLSSIALLSDPNGGMTGAQRSQLQRIGQLARDMVTDLRDIVWAIDPDGDRIHDVVARMQDVAGDLLRGVHVTFDLPDAAALAPRIGMAERRDLLRIYKEVLHNIVRHASATAVDIALLVRGDVIELTVVDNGTGFDGSARRAGTGLRSMTERAHQLGWTLELASRPGAGTRVRLVLRK
jgi:signal transduction histidine kinase